MEKNGMETENMMMVNKNLKFEVEYYNGEKMEKEKNMMMAN